MGPICVLLVEDDLITRRIVANYLASCFYDVIEAENGRVALDILNSPKGDSVDIILTDNVMPEITGLELIVTLVQAKQWQHLPVIIMSSEMREDVVQQAMAAGACGFLHKPVQRTEINSLWKHAQKGSRRHTGANLWGGNLAAPSHSDDSGATEAACQEAAGVELSAEAADVSERKQEVVTSHPGASAYWEGGLSVRQYEPGMSSSIGPTPSPSWPPPPMCTTASILAPWSRIPQGMPLEIRPLDLEKTASIASSASTALRCLVPSMKEDACWKEEKEAQPSLPPIFGPSVSAPVSATLQPHHQLLLQSFQAAVAQQQHSREAITANRRAAIARFRAKRAARCFEKKVRYVNRKKLAETRPRVRGQFCKAVPEAAAESSVTEP